MPQNTSVDDTDIDFYAINYGVNHQRFLETMEMMLGLNVMLSSSSQHSHPSTNYLNQRTFPVSFHSLIYAFNHCFQVFLIEKLTDYELFINPRWRPCFHIVYSYVIFFFFFLIPKFIQLFLF